MQAGIVTGSDIDWYRRWPMSVRRADSPPYATSPSPYNRNCDKRLASYAMIDNTENGVNTCYNRS